MMGLVLVLFCSGLLISQKDRSVSPLDPVHYAAIKPRHALGRYVCVRGTVISIPKRKVYGKKITDSFVLEVKQLEIQSWKKTKIYLVAGKVQVFAFQPPDEVFLGDEVQLKGYLDLPKHPLNPGEFNYQEYLHQQKIYSVLRCFGKSLSIQMRSQNLWVRAVWWIRDYFSKQISQRYSLEYQPMMRALMIGDQKGIDDRSRDIFMKSGTSHLLAVSGLNVTLMIGSLYGVFLVLRIGQKGAALISLALMMLYVGIAGLGYPVIRATIMGVFVMTAVFFEKPKSSLHLLCLAFFSILLIDSQAVFSISFQLSYLSVLALILGGGSLVEFQKWNWISSSVMAMVGTFPLVLYHFSIFSPVGILANLYAIPLFHLGLLWGFIGVCFSPLSYLSQGLCRLSELSLQAGVFWIEICSKIPGAYVYLSPPSNLQIVSYYVCCVLGWWGLRFRKKIKHPFIFFGVLILIWSVTLSSFFMNPAYEKKQRVIFFSAGASQLAVIQLGKQVVLINAGRSYPSNQARWILEPFLREEGIASIEAVILMDYSAKNRGGLVSLQRNFKIQKIVLPPPSSKDLSLYRYLCKSSNCQVFPKEQSFSFLSKELIIQKNKESDHLEMEFLGQKFLWIEGVWKTKDQIIFSRKSTDIFPDKWKNSSLKLYDLSRRGAAVISI